MKDNLATDTSFLRNERAFTQVKFFRQTYIIIFIFIALSVGLSSCSKSSNNHSAPKSAQKSKVNPERTPTELEKSWNELVFQYARRNQTISILINYMNRLSAAELNSLIDELVAANAAASTPPHSPEIMKSPEDYAKVAVAEKKLSAALTALIDAEKRRASHFKNNEQEDLLVILDGIYMRMKAERIKSIRYMIENDGCIKLGPADWLLNTEKFCSTVKEHLSTGECLSQYQPFVHGEICP